MEVEAHRASKIKFAFHQRVLRKADDKVMLDAIVTGASVNERGRPFFVWRSR